MNANKIREKGKMNKLQLENHMRAVWVILD